MESSYCGAGSGWACNEIGIRLSAGGLTAGDAMDAQQSFARACELGFGPGCTNSLGLAPGAAQRAPPRLIDWYFLLQSGKGVLPDATAAIDLYAAACEQGWPAGCRAVGQSYLEGRGVPVDYAAAAEGRRRGPELRQPGAHVPQGGRRAPGPGARRRAAPPGL